MATNTQQEHIAKYNNFILPAYVPFTFKPTISPPKIFGIMNRRYYMNLLQNN